MKIKYLKEMDLRNLQFLFKPQYWLMNHEYNKEVDKIINDLLDRHELKFKQIPYIPYTSELVCMLGDAEIWVGNIPYGFGTLYGTELSNYRPSRLTIQRLLKRYNKLKKQSMDEKVKKNTFRF